MTDPARDVVIRGARVTLARFRESDVEAVHSFASDPEVCRFTGWGPNTLDDTRTFVAAAVRPQGDRYDLAVLRGDQLIGSASVWTTSPDHGVGEMGYTIRRDCWGEGHASEVARLLVDLGFNRLHLERLAATCDPGNAASVRVLEKAGLRREGLLRGLYLVRGRRRDRLVFACLRSDFAETLSDAANS
jgi:RimJ/RimL family protein N-acetyltransferase